MDKNADMRDRYERLIRVCVANAEPVIVIWGPGRYKAQDYQKRKRLRKVIQGEVPNGRVIFPEDHEVQKASSEVLGGDDIVATELLQALDADIIIALDISAAVGEEVARYSAYPKVVGKLFVIAPEEHKFGYQEAIRNNVIVKFVTTAEMVSCEKTTEFCVKHVRAWCVEKYASR